MIRCGRRNIISKQLGLDASPAEFDAQMAEISRALRNVTVRSKLPSMTCLCHVPLATLKLLVCLQSSTDSQTDSTTTVDPETPSSTPAPAAESGAKV